MDTLIRALIVFSAACSTWGTITVAISYGRGHLLATQLRAAVAAEDSEAAQVGFGALFKGVSEAGWEVQDTKGHLRDFRLWVADQLSRRWWMTAGLIAYVAAAAAAAAAGWLAT